MAILLGEPEREAFLATIRADPGPRLSAANYVETGAVVDRLGDPTRSRLLDELVESLGLRIEPVTVEQARTARAAHRDFGRGSGHRARLNFGDTFGYALAVTTGEPLLFQGDDFRETDVRRALP
ncbi:type II toxin-antitoxin system VapC family toxin [Luteimicrobium album]|nr:type II toxin-antitoxin system VapC family toxin [Luteimicrobium album]